MIRFNGNDMETDRLKMNIKKDWAPYYSIMMAKISKQNTS